MSKKNGSYGLNLESLGDVPIDNFIVKGSEAIQVNSPRQYLLYGSVIQRKIVKIQPGTSATLIYLLHGWVIAGFPNKKEFQTERVSYPKNFDSHSLEGWLRGANGKYRNNSFVVR